jgi:hypothetical protein
VQKKKKVPSCAVSLCLLCPSTRRGRVRQIISSAKRFQRGDWKSLWETALLFARKEIDTNNKRKHNRAKRDTSTIRARVVYAEHCARKGALSKANQAITSTAMPNAISFMPAIASTSGRLHSEFIRLLFLQAHRETDRFFAASGVQSAQSNLGSSYFHFRRAAFSSMLKSKCGLILAKAAALCINLNLDGAPITSQSHTHPSHSQTYRLLTSSLSLGVPVPRPTQCMRGA